MLLLGEQVSQLPPQGAARGDAKSSPNRSKSGIVNVYDSETSTSWRKSDRPKPLKAIGNLTTSISVAQFNPDSQLLAIASKAQKDQLRLV